MEKQTCKEKIILCCLSLVCTVMSLVYAIMCAYRGFLLINAIHVLHTIVPALLLSLVIIPLVLNILAFIGKSNRKAYIYSLIAVLLCLIINAFRFLFSFTTWDFPAGSFIVLLITLFLFICLLLLRNYFIKNSSYEEEIDIQTKADGYVSIGKLVLLTLCTLGIWTCYWYYKTTKYLNLLCAENEQRDPLNKMLLCVFVPFYSIYWIYKSAKIIDNHTASDIAGMCVIVDIFISIVVFAILQSNINEISLSNRERGVSFNFNTK